MKREEFDSLRKWCFQQTQNPGLPVLGWTATPADGKVSLVKTELSHYDRAYDVLDSQGNGFEISDPLTEAQIDSLASISIPVMLSAYPETLERSALLGKALEEYIPRHWGLIGIGLVDLSGFSALSGSTQLKALRVLDAALDYCNQQCISNTRTSSFQMSAWGRASTGDGYYLFPVKPNRVQNLRLLRGMLMLASIASYYQASSGNRIPLKICYTVDEVYTYYRSIREPSLANEGEPTPDAEVNVERKGKETINAIGRATNQLARMMHESKPGQFLISERALQYIAATNVRLAWGAGFLLDDADIGKTDNQGILDEMDSIAIDQTLAQEIATNFTKMFAASLADRKLAANADANYVPSDSLIEGNREQLLSVPEFDDPYGIDFGGRFVVKGKHEGDIEPVWNLRGTGFHLDRRVYFGLRHVKTEWLIEKEFVPWPNRGV